MQILDITTLPRKNQALLPGETQHLVLLSFELEQTSVLLFWNSSETYWKSGYWTQKTFSRVPKIRDKCDAAIFSFVSNENGSYLSYAANASVYPDTFIRFLIETSGQIKFYVLGKGFLQWNLIFMDPIELCGV